MRIDCLVIDDEPLARKGLTNFIQQLPQLQLVGAFPDPVEALPTLTARKVDLLFLDIRMPRMTGLELLRTLADPPITIIATAFPNHALEGYELNVMDYLIKPIPFERFVKAVNKAADYLALRSRVAEGHPPGDDHFFIKCENRYERIRYDELLYVEALQNYVILHTTGRRYISYLTFKSVEEYLPADRFLKVHKSYIVARSKIEGIEGTQLRIGTAEIGISRANKDEILDQILKNKLLRR